MNKILHTLKWFLLFTLWWSCETVVDFDVPRTPPKLVLNSVFEAGGPMQVHLSASRHILDKEPPPAVEGAQVQVYAHDTLLATLADSLEGRYMAADMQVKRGVTYTVTATKNGYESISATVTVPVDTAHITEVKMDTVEVNEFGYKTLQPRLQIMVDDPPGQEDFYMIAVFKEGYYYEYDYSVDPPVLIDSTEYYEQMDIYTRDPGVEEYMDYGQELLFKDDLFDGQQYTFNILLTVYIDEYSDLPEGNFTYRAAVAKISRGYYLYKASYEYQVWNTGNPFAQPVQVYTNVSNGYGILGGKNTVYISLD